MDENNNNTPVEKPEVLAQLEAAARKGLTKRAIARLCGKLPKEFDVYLLLHRESELALERGWADFEAGKRDRIEEIERAAIDKGELSLQYKINREAIKELNERDAVVRVQQVAPQEQGMPDPEWGELSAEEIAAIRENTEAKDRGNDAE